MRNLLVGAAALLMVTGTAAAHHTAASGRLVGHHAASSARVEAHHAATGSRVEAHHAASGARVEAHHTASDVTLAGSTAADEAAGVETVQGPHGGALVPLGDGVAVLEFTFDVTTGMFHMYVWDATLESPIGIRQNMVVLKVPVSPERDGGVMLVPVENEVTGDRKGDSATYVGGLESLIGRDEFEVLLEGVMVDDQLFRLVPFSMPAGNGLGPGFPAHVEVPEAE